MATFMREAARERTDAREDEATPAAPRRRNDAIAAEAERRRAERGEATEPDASLDENIEAGIGVPVSDHELSLTLNLGANQTLFRDAENSLFTTKGARLHIVVSGGGIYLGCDGIVLENNPDGLYSPDFAINTIRWSYGGPVRVDADAMLFEARGERGIAAAVQEGIVDKLPAHMNQDDYNPFEDPALFENLQSVFTGPTETRSSAGTGGGERSAGERDASGAGAAAGRAGGRAAADTDAGGLDIESRNARLSFGFTLDEQYRVGAEGGSPAIVFAAGSQMRAIAETPGGLPDDLDSLQLDTVTLRCHGDVAIKVGDGDFRPITIRSMTVENGGAVKFEYDLITEGVSDLVKLLGALMAVESGVPADRIRLRASRHDGIREIVDRKLDENATPMIRELLCEYATTIPGVDLAKALGLP